MARILILNRLGNDITKEVTLKVVAEGFVHVFNQAGTDITPDITFAMVGKDYEAGQGDCKAGYYDKWYRYNRVDNGEEYDLGWRHANATVMNERVNFIEG